MICDIESIPASAMPQAFIKAAWKADGSVSVLLAGNLDGEPKVVQADILRTMHHTVESEMERLGIEY